MNNKQKRQIKSKYMIVAVILITMIIGGCVAFCICYVKKNLLISEKTSAVNSSMLIVHNFSITDREVEYMKALSFNEMELDPINHRLADVATGINFEEPIISVYLVAPLRDTEVKYTIDESTAKFFEQPVGTELNAIWLLNMAVDENGNAVFKEREDIYRYTVITEELKNAFDSKNAVGVHSIDEWGEVITGYTPVYTTEGNFVGVLGVDFDYTEYCKKINHTLIIIALILGISMLSLVLIFLWIYNRYASEEKENRKVLQMEKESLSSILNNILVGIYVYRFDGDDITVANANSYIIEMLGRDRELLKKAKNDDMFTYVHPDDVEIIREVIKTIKVPGQAITKEFRLLNNKSNEYMWLVLKGQGIAQSDGTVLAYVCYIDVSDRKRLESIENELKVEQAAGKAKTDFLATMSHDMRTPMNGILGLVTLMMDQELTPEIRNNLHQIQLSGKYLLNLINDTLDLNKIAANKLELHPVVVNSFKITENLVANAQMLANEKGVQFEFEQINPEQITSIMLDVDSARVEQLFMNIVSNAIKFTPSGGMVRVTMERLDSTADTIVNRYQVIDTGIGMSQEFMKHLYEPFVQEGRSATNREEGTGLGMTIVHRLIELMNGKIEVSSAIGEGTIFTITIPFIKYQGDTDAKEMLYQENINLSGKHVLLVEDHPLNRQIAVKLLEKKGMIVDTAENGQIAVEKYRESDINYYSVILMDIRMPIMDGLAATREIRNSDREDSASVPIIAMTANAFDDDVKACRDAGMNDHISKPIEVEKMYQSIENQLVR